MWPNLRSSPWILSYPQLSFSFAICTISASTSAVILGLPGFPFRLYVHLRRTSSRCQRSTVSGLKIIIT
jgi:hypothetical protein